MPGRALLSVLLLITAGCGGGANNNTNIAANAGIADEQNAAAPKTNVEELALIVRVPYEVEDIVWNEDSDRVLAVLRFSPKVAEAVVADASRHGAPQSVTVAFESWFPDELTAQSDMSGDSLLKGTAYSADAFFQEPFNKGRIVKINDVDHFVLELTSK